MVTPTRSNKNKRVVIFLIIFVFDESMLQFGIWAVMMMIMNVVYEGNVKRIESDTCRACRTLRVLLAM
jgi:hypothetical protein